MRGTDRQAGRLRQPESLVPADHPLRPLSRAFTGWSGLVIAYVPSPE